MLLIERFAVRIEEASKLAAHGFMLTFWYFGWRKITEFRFCFDLDKEVKMIAQQTIGVGRRYRIDVFCILLQEIRIIAFIGKKLLFAIGSIENMVELFGLKIVCVFKHRALFLNMVQTDWT